MSYIEPTLLSIIQLAQSSDISNNQLAKQLIIGQKINKIDFCWQVANAEILTLEKHNFEFDKNEYKNSGAARFFNLETRFLTAHNLLIYKSNLNYVFSVNIKNSNQKCKNLKLFAHIRKQLISNKIVKSMLWFLDFDFKKFKIELVCRIAWELFRIPKTQIK